MDIKDLELEAKDARSKVLDALSQRGLSIHRTRANVLLHETLEDFIDYFGSTTTPEVDLIRQKEAFKALDGAREAIQLYLIARDQGMDAALIFKLSRIP